MSTSIVDATPSLLHPDTLDPPCVTTLFPIDKPISPNEISPLVDQVHAGFRCADLLLRLPGAIPIPSFTIHPSLPSTDWVDVSTQSFVPGVVHHLLEDPRSYPLPSSIPFPLVSSDQAKIPSPPRSIIQSPLLVRPPNPSVYSPEGRSQFLSSIGIPKYAHDPDETRILIVSFGGQIFHAPRSRSPSPAPSRSGTPNHSPYRSGRHKLATPDSSPDRPYTPITDLILTDCLLAEGVLPSPLKAKVKLKLNSLAPDPGEPAAEESMAIGSPNSMVFADFTNNPARRNTTDHPQPPKAPTSRRRSNSQRIATDHHLWLPGAPGAVRKSEFASPTTPYTPSFEPTRSLLFPQPLPVVITTPPTPLPTIPQEYSPIVAEYVSLVNSPSGLTNANLASTELTEIPGLLPDGWIAVVCGASKGQDEGVENLPEGFYIAPKDVYMPDLIAVADVLLGKLVGPLLLFVLPTIYKFFAGVRKCLGSTRLSDSFRLCFQTIVH